MITNNNNIIDKSKLRTLPQQVLDNKNKIKELNNENAKLKFDDIVIEKGE
jgi:hypothetical protein